MANVSAIPRRIRALIGEIVLLGAQIEHLTTMCLLKELDVEIFAGLSILRNNNVNQKLSKLLFLVESRLDSDFAEKYDVLSVKLDKFLECRNNLAHSYYSGTQYDKIIEIDYKFADNSDLGSGPIKHLALPLGG